MNDTVYRQAVIDALDENKDMINAALDSLTLDYNTRRNLEQRRGQINEDVETIKELPSAQPEPYKRSKDAEMHCFDADALIDIFEDRLEKVRNRYGDYSEEAGVLAGALRLIRAQPTIDIPTDAVIVVSEDGTVCKVTGVKI